MTEQLKLRGTLKGHGGWVTQIATTAADPDTILSASRGSDNYMYFLIFIIWGVFQTRL